MDEMCYLDSISSGHELILELLLNLGCGIFKPSCNYLNWPAVYFGIDFKYFQERMSLSYVLELLKIINNVIK